MIHRCERCGTVRHGEGECFWCSAAAAFDKGAPLATSALLGAVKSTPPRPNPGEIVPFRRKEA